MEQSNNIEVGDVCIVVPHADGVPDIVGKEVEVIGPELRRRFELSCVIFECFGFEIYCPSNGRRYAIARECLRKKRPPGDQSEWIRQETTPRGRFDEWLERVRDHAVVEEPA